MEKEISSKDVAEQESLSGSNDLPIPNKWTHVDWLVRAGLAVFLIFCLIAMLLDFFGVPVGFSNPPNKNSLSSDDRLGLIQAAPFLFVDDFKSGNWTIGDSDWEFQVDQVASKPPESAWLAPPQVRRIGDQHFKDDVFVELFKSLSAGKHYSDGLTIWRAENEEAKLVMFTEIQGEREVVQGIKACYPDSEGYVLMVGLPASSNETSFEDFLPLCDGAELLACRKSDTGIVTSAIIDYSRKNIDIRDFWKEDGWQVVLLSELHDPNARYEYHKNGVQVAASFLAEANGKFKVVLVRMPDVERTR